MTDYKSFGRIPRPLPPVNFDKLMIALFIVFILVALSMAGNADMQAAQWIDKQTLAENAQRAVKQQEMDLTRYYTERSR
jgi:hypothetical protein